MYHHSGNAPFSHLLCLLLALLVLAGAGSQTATKTTTTKTTTTTVATTTSCPGDISPPCLGDRPTIATTGCCPVGAWQPCQPSHGRSCDHELGLFCRNERGLAVADDIGRCKGDFQLNVTSRGERILDLEWLHFASADYQYEYVVLYRENTYKHDISQWTLREIGNTPKCSLERLKPATLHFIRVAIWEDARAGILGKMTETINVITRRSEFCIHMGEFLETGQQVINDCEEKCTCLPTGEFECSPLCEMHGVPDVEEGCHVIPGDNCCDFKVSCSVGGAPCQVDNTTYAHGSEFEHNCRQCTCSHGQVECHFPEECEEMEPTLQCLKPERVEVKGQCCPEWHCSDLSDDACHYEMQQYEYGEYFSSANCGLCQCRGAEGVHCPPECPPVVMVLPSLECPDPQIRKDGCCDTLHCNYANLSLAPLISRMFAISYSPVTLTVSFEASPVSEESEVPLYQQYEVLFANTSDSQLSWNRRLVQPVDVRLRRDRPSRDQSALTAPVEALTRDNAIVVGERVYITLSGMDPDTTYYVKVNLHYQNMMDGEQGQKGDISANTATVVVKTMPLDNVSSCIYEGKQVRHGRVAKTTCNETCTCTLGRVTCASTCEADQVVVARSHSCPEPRLERVQGQCCPEWKCYPSATGCFYNGMIMSSGQSVRNACDVCTCRNASMTCASQCQDTKTPPRPECVLANVTGQCCPQWTCPIESHPPLGVRTSLNVYLDARCPNEASGSSTFKRDLEKNLMNLVNSACTENQAVPFTHYCNSLQINVRCSHNNLMYSKSQRRKRNASFISTTGTPSADLGPPSEISVQILLFANFSEESPADLTGELLQSAALQLVARLNRSLQVQLPDGETARVVKISTLSKVSYICDSGFAFERGHCVLSEVETDLVSRLSTTMVATDIKDTLAVLTWGPLGDKALAHISKLVVEHRRWGDLDWIPSIPLEPHRSTYLLLSLTGNQDYAVRLVATVTWPEQSRWVMGEMAIKTPQPSEKLVGLRLILTKVSVFEDCALVYWDKMSEKIPSNINFLEIRWRKTQEYIYRYSEKLRDVDKTFARITGLLEDTAYTAEVRIYLKSGSTIDSGLIHFVTKAQKNTWEDFVLVICVSSAISFLVAGVLAVVIVLWRLKKDDKSAGGFVNNTFGVQLNSKKDIDPAANPGVI